MTGFTDFQVIAIFLYMAAGLFTFAWMLYIGSKLGQILDTLQEQEKHGLVDDMGMSANMPKIK